MNTEYTANQASDMDPKKREDNYTIAQNEGNAYDKDAPEEGFEKKEMGITNGGDDDNNKDAPPSPSQPTTPQKDKQHQEETGPATPPEKTREAPKADK